MNETKNKGIVLMKRKVYKDDEPLNPKNWKYPLDDKDKDKGILLMKRNNLSKNDIHNPKRK